MISWMAPFMDSSGVGSNMSDVKKLNLLNILCGLIPRDYSDFATVFVERYILRLFHHEDW